LPRRIRPQRAFIGVRFDFSTSAAKIEEVLPGMGAEKAGLARGDLVWALNHAAVTNRDQIIETLRDCREGQTVTLRVQREDRQFEVEVRLMAPGAGQLGLGGSPQDRFNLLGGEVSSRAEGFEQVIQHDTVLQPWLCGGPLVNLDGQAMGLNIARAGRVATYALPPKLVTRIFEGLKSKPGQGIKPGQ
jgi:S1-C subfamily serine protease